MIQTLAALAEPNRLAIVEFLRDGPRSVTDIVDRLGLSQPLVSKHLKVLSDVAIVDRRVDGKRRIYALEQARFAELDRWLDTFAELWDRAARSTAGAPRPNGGRLMSGLLVSKDLARPRDRARARAARLGRRRLAQLDDCGRPRGVVGSGGLGDHGALARRATRRPVALRHGSDRRAARSVGPVDLQRGHHRLGALVRRRVLRRDRRRPRPRIAGRDRRVHRRRARPHAARAAHALHLRRPPRADHRDGHGRGLDRRHSTDSTTC